MKIYRATELTYGSRDKIFRGTGASLHPGRWNVSGMPCIYGSSSVVVVAAELAFNHLTTPIELYHNEQSRRRNFPRGLYEDVVDKEFKLAIVDFKAPEKLIDLTNAMKIADQLKRFGLPPQTLHDSRISAYALGPRPLWTRKLGQLLRDEGAVGIITLSARSNDGHNVSLFDENLTEEMLELQPIESIVVSAPKLGTTAKLKYAEPIEMNKILFESPLGSGPADLLTF